MFWRGRASCRFKWLWWLNTPLCLLVRPFSSVFESLNTPSFLLVTPSTTVFLLAYLFFITHEIGGDYSAFQLGTVRRAKPPNRPSHPSVSLETTVDKKTHWIQCEEQPGKQVYCSIIGRVYVSGRISLVISSPDFIWQKMWQGDIENKMPPVW